MRERNRESSLEKDKIIERGNPMNEKREKTNGRERRDRTKESNEDKDPKFAIYLWILTSLVCPTL